MARAHGLADSTLAALRTCSDDDEVRTRALDLAAHANDASHYLLRPQAVVVPADAREVANLLRLGVRDRLALTFRSGGTSLSGQGVTDGVLVDTRRHFRGFEVLDDGRAVRVGPGLTVADVNARLARYGRKIGPDPARREACTIGGVVANNSSGMACGTEFNTYRDAGVDDVRAPVGHRHRLRAPRRRRRAAPPRAGAVRGPRPAARPRPREPELRRADLRHLFSMKNTMGYGLNSFLDHTRPIDLLTHLLVGSRGDAGLRRRGGVRDAAGPPARGDVDAALRRDRRRHDALPALLEAGARTLELLDAGRWSSRSPTRGRRSRCATSRWTATRRCSSSSRPPPPRSSTRVQAGAEPVLAGLPLTRAAGLTREPTARASLWASARGSTPRSRPPGRPGRPRCSRTSRCPSGRCPSTCDGLTELFDRHGYEGAVIFGHAKDGNVHFLVNERFDDEVSLERYRRFTEEMVDLVLSQDGTLKAEHGTGRIMAPFVRRQYGDELYDVMRELKALCDPTGLLNPGIMLSDDPDAHLRDLKIVPTVDAEVDACVECGYCEPVCPSRDVTTTPRQRIVLPPRDRRDGPGPGRRRADEDYPYDAVDTCAADGMCATACPVRINTGDLMKRLRSERHGERAQAAGTAVARHWDGVSGTARVALRAAATLPGLATAASALARRVLPEDLVPLYAREVPSGADTRPAPVYPAAPDVVFFPTCIDSLFGAAATATSRRRSAPRRLPGALRACPAAARGTGGDRRPVLRNAVEIQGADPGVRGDGRAYLRRGLGRLGRRTPPGGLRGLLLRARAARAGFRAERRGADPLPVTHPDRRGVVRPRRGAAPAHLPAAVRRGGRTPDLRERASQLDGGPDRARRRLRRERRRPDDLELLRFRRGPGPAASRGHRRGDRRPGCRARRSAVRRVRVEQSHLRAGHVPGDRPNLPAHPRTPGVRDPMKVLLPTSMPLAPAVPADVELVHYRPDEPVPLDAEDAEVLVVWGNPESQLRDCARRLGALRLVQSLAAGTEQVLAAGFAPEVVITSGRSLHDQPVAEHTLALVLAAARRLHRLTRAQIGHRWAGELGGVQPVSEPNAFRTLRDARVLLWGFGSIGTALAPHLSALGAKVTGVARTAGVRAGFPVIGVEELPGRLPDTDLLIMILPATPGTRHALNADRLALLPPHAWLVNVGRSSTVQTDALLAAVRAGRLGGAALDVFATEPLPADSPLWDEPDIIVSPHAAGGRPLGADDLIAENLRALLAGEPPRNVVER